MDQPSKPRRGGRRPGAGRPPGHGPYREATKAIRVPVSLADRVTQWLERYRADLDALPTSSSVFEVLEATKTQLPLYGANVRAGFPSPADDHLEQQLDINDYLVERPASTFLLRVAGDSMEGAGIREGDILVVDRSVKPVNDKIVVAALDGDLTVKRLRLKGGAALVAENPDYPPIPLHGDIDLVIWGVVVGVVRRMQP